MSFAQTVATTWGVLSSLNQKANPAALVLASIRSSRAIDRENAVVLDGAMVRENFA